MITNKQSNENECSLRQKGISVAVSALLVMTVALCLYAAIQAMTKGYVQIFGISMFRVVTGSMEPQIPVGALLLTKATDIDKIALRDVVCFRTQDAAIWGKVVTHRVVEILQMNGEILLRTQGDANLASDGYLVDQYTLIGKVIWHTGDGSVLAGIFSFCTNKVGFLGCIVLPCLLLSCLLLTAPIVFRWILLLFDGGLFALVQTLCDTATLATFALLPYALIDTKRK